jgi:hypothetical protein
MNDGRAKLTPRANDDDSHIGPDTHQFTVNS